MTELILTSSALILFLIIIRKLLRGKISPTVQYALWLLVAVRLLIPGTLFTAPVSLLGSIRPLLTTIEDSLFPEDTLPPVADAYTPAVPETVPPSAVTDYGDTIIATYQPQATAPTDVRTVNWATEIWKLGIIAVGSALLLSNLSFYVNLRRKRRLIPASELPRPFYLNVYQVSGLVTPCLFGLVRPAVYLTGNTLTSEELEHILTHEETHYRHGDHLWAILRSVCLAVHWYNPLVWWAAILSRQDCELSCDAGAIRRLGEENRIRYGETLLRMVVPGRHPANLLRTATTMSGGKKTMAERITLIAKRPKMLKITLAAVVLIACGAAVFFFGGAAEEPATSNDTLIAEDTLNEDQKITESHSTSKDFTLTESDAVELYYQAREIWNWFEFGTLPTTDTTLQTEEGTMLQVSGFNSLEELRRHLEKYFTLNWAEHLLSDYMSFQESDGKLFVLPAERPRNIYAGEETVSAFLSNSVSYDCHIYATTEVLDFYEPDTVLYLKRHDWYIMWNEENYVFTTFGPDDDVDPQKYYNALTILDHYNRGNTITTWYPVLANLDWNALYATEDQWPEGFDLGMYIVSSISQYITDYGSEMTHAQYDHILSATEGLDGAYSEGFGYEVYRLYENNPGLFAYSVLNDLSLDNRNRALDLFRYEEVMRGIREVPLVREETYNVLQDALSASISATPASMAFDQPGQKEQLLLANAHGIYAASYYSSDTDVATVDEDGFVTAVGPGSATITLHYEGAAGQKDLTCAVSCEWTASENSPNTSQMQDSEIILGLSRGYSPTVWSIGSPENLEITLSGDWTLEGIRNALFAAVNQYVAGTLLEDDLRDITLSYGFQFPDQMENGVTMEVPYFIDYVDADVHTLPSGATHSPSCRTDELTAIVHLEGSGTSAPADAEFTTHQAEYQKLQSCVTIPDLEVAHDWESYDIIGAIQNAIDANLAAADLADRFHIQSVSLGSYYNPVWVDPGTVQTISGTVGFTGSFQATFEFSFTVTTIQ